MDSRPETDSFKIAALTVLDPITHVIEYTLGGLLMSHLMNMSAVRDLNILPAVIRAADALLPAIQNNPVRGIEGMVPTSFDRNSHSADDHSCLTGNAQLAYFFFLLSRTTGDERYRKLAESILRATKRTQRIETSFAPVKGAIAGTYPLFYKVIILIVILTGPQSSLQMP